MNERWKLIERDDSPYDAAKLRNALIVAGADVLLIALGVFAFIFLRYGIVRAEAGLHIASPRDGSAFVMTEDFITADNGGDAGRFSFDGRFLHETPAFETSGDTTYYYDAGCEIALTTYFLETGPVYVADVYVNDIARLQTALANDTYGKGQREEASAIAARSGAIFSITGDNYSERFGGVVMRNGVLYSKEVYRDVCVLYWDGTVDVIPALEFDLTSVMDKHPYQIWSFGPAVFLDGEIPADYDTDIRTPSRRAAFGYYEPGHYCFVLMEGAVTLSSLSETMAALGCDTAYALYGGSLAEMGLNGAEISIPQEAERACSDIIMITK